MLDPKIVSDNVVDRFAVDEAMKKSLLANRVYKNVTDMIAGMQEYTAVQAMYEFVQSGRYDLVVLDTPPSRNALHFLEAPRRVARLIDGRVLRFFLPGEDGFVKRTAGKAITKVMDIALGAESREDLMTFFSLFASVLKRLNKNADAMREFFRSDAVSFLVVTSPARESLEEAAYFETKARDELKLPLEGFVLNRSLAYADGMAFPDEAFFAGSEVSAEARAQVRCWAERERELMQEHRELLDDLIARAGDGKLAIAAPYLKEGVSDIRSLAVLADVLVPP